MATLSAILDEVSVEKTAVPAGRSSEKRDMGTGGERRDMVMLSECPFSRVVVYQDQAEVRRDLSCSLSEGESTVRIVGFPEVTDPDSVRVELKRHQSEGLAVISDVVYVSQYRVEREAAPAEEGEEASSSSVMSERDQLKHEKLVIEGKLSVLRRELKLVQALNAVLQGEEVRSSEEATARVKQASNRESLQRVVEFVEYSCSRRDELERRVSALSDQLDCVARKLETVEMNEAKSGGRTREGKQQQEEFVGAVEIAFESDCVQSVQVLVSYVVSNASWSSLYHLRVSTQESSVQVHYFGQVKQWTGEDWVNTYISLSTASPSKGGNPPQLEPHNISRYYPPQPNFYHAGLRHSMDECEMSYKEQAFSMSSGQERFRTITQAPPRPPMRPVEVSKSQLQTGLFIQTFDVLRPASIPSDSTEHKVSVCVIDLESSFENVCIPEKSSNVYLVAKATNTSEYPLLSGPSSVFMDNNFISKSALKSVSPGEEITCSLGVDPLVRVSLKAGDSYQSHQAGWISKGTVSEEYSKVTCVKNTKKSPISVKVVESVPVSEDERVKVHLLEPVCARAGVKVGVSGGGSVMLNEKNQLEWCMQVQPTSQRKFLLNYVVEYPASKY